LSHIRVHLNQTIPGLDSNLDKEALKTLDDLVESIIVVRIAYKSNPERLDDYTKLAEDICSVLNNAVTYRHVDVDSTIAALADDWLLVTSPGHTQEDHQLINRTLTELERAEEALPNIVQPNKYPTKSVLYRDEETKFFIPKRLVDSLQPLD